MIPRRDLAKIAGYLSHPSAIAEHDDSCCELACAWLRGVDTTRSYREGMWTPPVWVREEFDWGPVKWPLYWCDVAIATQLDCGALAAVTKSLLSWRGGETVAVQLALRYPKHANEQWRQMWRREGLDDGWLLENFCYHEAVGIVDNESIEVWDPTENTLLAVPEDSRGRFATVVAIRIVDESPVRTLLRWRGVELRVGDWHFFKRVAGAMTATPLNR